MARGPRLCLVYSPSHDDEQGYWKAPGFVLTALVHAMTAWTLESVSEQPPPPPEGTGVLGPPEGPEGKPLPPEPELPPFG